MLKARHFVCALAAAIPPLLANPAHAATVERVSVSSDGSQGNAESLVPSISADGRFVAFVPAASNLVPNDSNGYRDIFVRDRLLGTTECGSIGSSGQQPNADCEYPSISGDGRFVAFFSWATNLVPGDTNAKSDVFVRDRQTAITERISVSTDGTEANSSSGQPAISADGRFVAFVSSASNLVLGDTNNQYDVFVRGRQTGITERVSVSSAGAQATSYCIDPSISADGRFVAFESQASSLVVGDTNHAHDAFVHDRQTGVTERVSVDSSGVQGNDQSYSTSLSADGRFVTFYSYATNLVPGDTNAKEDGFVRDRQTGVTERVSVASDGVQGNGGSAATSISADGRYVALVSESVNLVPDDANLSRDVFVRDRQTGSTARVSLASDGTEGNFDSSGPIVSADGRFVVFSSAASNLVLGDTNGAMDVFVRPAPAAPPGIAINSGASCTSSTSVTLNIACGSCSEIRFENDGESWTDWEACSATRAWMLTSGAGTKRVYVQGRDAQSVESAVVYDDIGYLTPPAGASIDINSGAACADSASVMLTLAATGASEMRFRNETGTWSAWEPFATSKAWALSSTRGTRTVGFQARDACENTATEVTDTITRPVFDDVLCANSLKPYVEALVREGITGGCVASPPLYCPDATVNRAQMAKFLCIAAGKEPLDKATPTFADVPKTHWAYTYVERLADAASWGGTPPTGGCRVVGTNRYFCPNDPVTREQMAKFLCVATSRSPMPSCTGAFGDVLSGSAFCPYVERLTDAPSWPGGVAVTSGCAVGPPRLYCPKANVTRSQMAVFLVRAFGIAL